MEYSERVKELEAELKKTKYNKRTQHAIGLLKAKISNLKKKESGQKKAGGGKGYSIKKSGDATVVMVGFPSVGKSTLLNAITNQESEVGGYDFTTLDAIPGLLEYGQAKIQIFDLPGLVEGAASGTGRGKEVLAVVRNADLCLILLDINKPEQLDIVKKELYDTGVRINEYLPDIRMRKKAKGGILIGKTVPLKVSDETLKGILRELGINNAEILIRTKVDEDQFIDAIEGNKKYLNAVVILNKGDSVSWVKTKEISKKINADIVISADKKINLERLKKLIFEKLNFIRIYLKEPGKEADMDEPLIMKKGCNIQDVCEKLHRDFINKFRFTRVWGKSAKFAGQRLMLNHKLKDKDIIELHLN